MNWTTVCTLDDIIPNSGRAALLNGEQLAIFRLNNNGTDQVFATANFDPFSEANVLSRGIIGSLKDTLIVASPIYKQHFCLQTGQCLEDENVRLKVWPAQIIDNKVQVQTL